MRITGGAFAGRKIQPPKGPAIRPTLEQVRQAIFNMLGNRMAGARVLDLFSGSGAFGIEALSRGAAQVTFVDRSFFCIQAIEANLAATAVSTALFTVIRAEALTALRKFRREETVFDLVFLDPPYGHRLARISLNALLQYAILSPAGGVVAEHDKRDSLPPQIEGKEGRLVLQRRQRYGDTVLTFYQFCGVRPQGV